MYTTSDDIVRPMFSMIHYAISFFLILLFQSQYKNDYIYTTLFVSMLTFKDFWFLCFFLKTSVL